MWYPATECASKDTRDGSFLGWRYDLGSTWVVGGTDMAHFGLNIVFTTVSERIDLKNPNFGLFVDVAAEASVLHHCTFIDNSDTS